MGGIYRVLEAGALSLRAVASRGAQQANWQTVLILWGALLSTTFVYVGLLVSGAVTSSEAGDPMLPYVLAVAGVGVLAASVLVPRMLFGKSMQLWKPATDEVPDPNASVMFRDHTPKIRVFADPTKAEREVLQRFFTPFILGMALSEALAIFGFLLGMMQFAPLVWAPFFVVAWVSMLARFPSKARLLARVERTTGTRFERP